MSGEINIDTLYTYEQELKADEVVKELNELIDRILNHQPLFIKDVSTLLKAIILLEGKK